MVLVVTGILLGIRGGSLFSVDASVLVLAGAACLIAAPVLALVPVAAYFLSQKSRTGWYALGTLAITVIGMVLAAV